MKANLSCLVWSTDDLDTQAERLHDSENISDQDFTSYNSLTPKEKLVILEGILEDVEDYLMEHINNLICDGLHDHFRENLK